MAEGICDRGRDCVDPVQPELADEAGRGRGSGGRRRRRQVGAVVQRQLHEAHLLVSDNS